MQPQKTWLVIPVVSVVLGERGFSMKMAVLLIDPSYLFGCNVWGLLHEQLRVLKSKMTAIRVIFNGTL